MLLGSPRVAAGATNAEGLTTHTVYAGQTLGKIAKRYRVSVDDLCRVNSIPRSLRLRPGQKLVIPDEKWKEAPARAPHASKRWQDYAEKPRRRGYVVLESPTRKWRGFIVSSRGKVIKKAQGEVERMLASWRTGKRHPIDARLIRLLATISDNFGGRTIRVVSGYRERSYAVESKHKVGRALDFSIPGVPNPVLRDYLRTLADVGVGYYPHSTHVHVDVRDAAAYWVDTARPGEPPRYAHRAAPKDAEDTSTGPESPNDVDETQIWTAGEGGEDAESHL